MRVLGKKPAIVGPRLRGPASARRPAPALPERLRVAPPAELEGRAWRHLYIPLKLRVALTVLAGLLWVGFSLWLSRGWIRLPRRDLTAAGAAVLIAGYAPIPRSPNI